MFKRFLLIVTTSILLSGCTLPFIGDITNKSSGLQVTSTPQATVFLDDNSLGLSPILEEDLKPGKYTLKIVPTDSTIPSWETKITLSPGVLTVVDRKLSTNPEQSHGHVLSFEKLSSKDTTKIAVTTIPDSVTVTIDGSPKGFTPLSIDTISAGDHVILLSSPGFEDKTLRARTIDGYQLTITAQLAKQSLAPAITDNQEATPSSGFNLDDNPKTTPTPTPKPTITPVSPQSSSSANIKKPYVEIGSTPTGWLRVRSEPNTAAQEVAKVNPGDRFPYLDTQGGWNQITLTGGNKGWVSGQYSTVVK